MIILPARIYTTSMKKQTFNFSHMCNIGAEHASGKYFLFLNDDIGILHQGWLDRLTGHAAQEHVGAVGAKLLYPDSTDIQHDGVLNLTCGPSHAFSHMDDAQSYYFARNRVEYDWLAVTGACLMVDRQSSMRLAALMKDFRLPTMILTCVLNWQRLVIIMYVVMTSSCIIMSL